MAKKQRVLLGIVLLALAAGCGTSRIVYMDDDLPLAAPLEGNYGSATGAPGADWDDPPTRVARVSSLSGPVSVQPGGVEEWTPASLNLPLSGGDALWSGPQGRAELEVGSSGLRTSDATSLSLVRVNDRFFQVGLDQGLLMVHIIPGEFPDTAEVDTPAGAVNISDAGTYRVEVDPVKTEGSVTVRTGHAKISLEGEVIPVAAGERLLLTGGAAPSYRVEPAPAPDAFEIWSDARDRAAARSVSSRKLGRNVIGAADLDGCGEWKSSPQYGDTWVPRVTAGWAPYRMGHWMWRDPWGWTWVDDAPWGFAPSHYGRWASVDGAWAWVPRDPGATGARPVYAPALVAFAGHGSGPRTQKIPGGGVAWFPLGPREPYAPAYPVSKTYLKNVNAWAGPAQPAAKPVWANMAVPGALTAVPRSTFTSSAAVAPAAVPVKLGRNAPVGGAPALPPAAYNAPAAASQPPPGIRERPLVARSPIPAPPAPFAARIASIRSNHGRPLVASAVIPVQGQKPLRARSWTNAENRSPGAVLRNRTPERVAPPAPREDLPRQPVASSGRQGRQEGREARRPAAKGRAARGQGRTRPKAAGAKKGSRRK